MTAPSAGPAGACWDLGGALTRAATGVPCDLAGVELLIGNGTWLRRDDFVENFIAVDHSAAAALAFVDWDAVITALNSGSLPCSGGERALLRIAASMSGGIPVDLNDTLTSLDPVNVDLTAAAIRGATGRRPEPAIIGKEAEDT
jgi:hypothetical protein